MEIKLHRLDTFPAQDARGEQRTVHAYEHLVRVHTLLDMETQWEPTGIVEYKLDTGEHVEEDEDGAMWVAGSDMRLERKRMGSGGSPHRGQR